MRHLYFKLFKRNLILLLLGIFIVSCQDNSELENLTSSEKSSKEVSIELATTVAQNFSYDQGFFDNSNKSKAKNTYRTAAFKPDKKVKEVLTINASNNSPAFYVINFDPVGFVIVSGTKKQSPILAFSETGTFKTDLKKRSGGLKGWIKNRKQIAVKLSNTEKTYKVSEDIKQQWVYFKPPPIDEEEVRYYVVNDQYGPLLTTIWGQGTGFNNQAPDYNCSVGNTPDNGRAWAGCVAVAMAQMMKYWEFPSSYNWSSMSNGKYGGSEVSTLMRDIGDAVNMQWGCDDSGAFMDDALFAFHFYYGYNSTNLVDFNQQNLMSQLRRDRPVILAGNGHAWVCGGYKANRLVTVHNPGTMYEYETSTYLGVFLYMNWGWKGKDNGWFLEGDFTPGLSDYTLDYHDEMIINIEP